MRNVGVLLAGNIGNVVFTLGVLGVAARGMGVDGFGALVLLHAFAQGVGETLTFQSWQAVLRYGSRFAAEGDRLGVQRVIRFAILMDLAAGLAGMLLTMTIAAVAAPWLGWPPGTQDLAIPYLTIVLFLMHAAPTGVLRLFGRFDLWSAHSALNALARLILLAGAWALGAGFEGFVLAWWGGQVASFLLMNAFAGWELWRRGLLHDFPWFERRLARDLPDVWRFSWTTNVSATLETAFNNAGTVVVGAMLTPASAGLFRVAWQVANAISGLVRLVMNALYPEAARLGAAARHAELGRMTLKVALISGATATALLLFLAVGGRPLVELALGKAFGGAAGVLTWLAAAVTITAWALPLEPLLVSSDRAGAVLRARIAGCLTYLVVVVPLVRSFELEGAGMAACAAAAVTALGLALQARIPAS